MESEFPLASFSLFADNQKEKTQFNVFTFSSWTVWQNYFSEYADKHIIKTEKLIVCLLNEHFKGSTRMKTNG